MSNTSTASAKTTNTNPWGDWWKEKKRNNQDLLWAAENGNIEDVRRLLSKTGPLQDLTAEINHRGLDQWTALHFAANEGHIDIVRELLSHEDCDRECLSSINRTPLHLAAIRGHTNIVRLLLEDPCGSGIPVEKLSIDKNVKDADENTPLHYASEYGHCECIIYLVKEAQADPFMKNKYGYTPSDIAQNMKIRELFDRLIPRQLREVAEAGGLVGYGRTAVNGVLRHNDRINTVQRLMHSYNNVNKFLY